MVFCIFLLTTESTEGTERCSGFTGAPGLGRIRAMAGAPRLWPRGRESTWRSLGSPDLQGAKCSDTSQCLPGRSHRCYRFFSFSVSSAFSVVAEEIGAKEEEREG